MSTLRERLRADFQDTDTRDVYVDEFLNYSLATQIQVLREQRDMYPSDVAQATQLPLAEAEELEDPLYWSTAFPVLRRLARAFGAVLKVSFVSFGARLHDIDGMSRKALECVPFTEDPVFAETVPSVPVFRRFHSESCTLALDFSKQNICRGGWGVTTFAPDYDACWKLNDEAAFHQLSKSHLAVRR